MIAKCILCGKEETVTKLHKDYKRLRKDPDAVFYCQMCQLKLNNDAQQQNEILRRKD